MTLDTLKKARKLTEEIDKLSRGITCLKNMLGKPNIYIGRNGSSSYVDVDPSIAPVVVRLVLSHYEAERERLTAEFEDLQ